MISSVANCSSSSTIPLPRHVGDRSRSILDSRFGFAPCCDDLKTTKSAAGGDSRLRRELLGASNCPIKRPHCIHRTSACTQRRNRPLCLNGSEAACTRDQFVTVSVAVIHG